MEEERHPVRDDQSFLERAKEELEDVLDGEDEDGDRVARDPAEPIRGQVTPNPVTGQTEGTNG